ncbi:uncharacterized protein PHALS_05705 [Plasmopara halstedii]|uniref:Uncharacterized protein n=1 Tax=Plasmopara halstedii TaxID=4781 RepID=A0A0P1B3L3_PLAHL|nr:uncharacterized protein PHALS_05705 [Plasmopara halstedii]CEG48236.1 hypothetical protein PHALS_05705 [Plasmopara halstedii]|eukprot:XP_024584605.1 hypothetical protein PHALS_05705 [Plasmopara halstedii]
MSGLAFFAVDYFRVSIQNLHRRLHQANSGYSFEDRYVRLLCPSHKTSLSGHPDNTRRHLGCQKNNGSFWETRIHSPSNLHLTDQSFILKLNL